MKNSPQEQASKLVNQITNRVRAGVCRENPLASTEQINEATAERLRSLTQQLKSGAKKAIVVALLLLPMGCSAYDEAKEKREDAQEAETAAAVAVAGTVAVAPTVTTYGTAGTVGAGVGTVAGFVAGGAVLAHAEPTEGGVIETHGAVTPEGCKALAMRFKEWGRKVDLIEVRPNTIGTGGILQWECIFAGPDAEVGYDGFNRNYNNGEIAHD